MKRLSAFGESDVKEEGLPIFQTQVAVVVAVVVVVALVVVVVHIMILKVKAMKMMFNLACIVSLMLIVNLKKTQQTMKCYMQ